MAPAGSRLGRRMLALTAVACLVVGAAGCSSTAGSGTPPPSGAGGTSRGWQDVLTGGADMLDVATTVAPISSIARNIGGDRIRLRGIVPDATNSHTFEPAPSDAQTLARADLIVVNGLHLEEPTLQMATASKSAGTEIKALGDAASAEGDWLYDFSFPESAGDPNPHLWMSVPYARRYADLLRDWFGAADPANRAAYDANFAAYATRLDELDRLIRAGVATVPQANRKLLTYHDSWAYWAREYGFTVIGAVQASDFSDPSPQEVGRLIEQIRAARVPAVFGSEVFPSPVLEQIARESGATFVDRLRDDEPPGAPLSAEHTYLAMMKSDMTVLVAALGGDGAILEPLEVTDTWRP
jgi:manganese/iron transport system substrate-binding protein